MSDKDLLAGYQTITAAFGDGIGPELMDATLRIIAESGAKIRTDIVEIGEEVYKKGLTSGISESDMAIIMRNPVFLKAPITTPRGGGYKSLNVTIRKALDLYANIRPTLSYYPIIDTKFPNLDVVIVRENQEDLYSGIEYSQIPDICYSLKISTRFGCENIIRYAFDYAIKNNRKKVTLMVKDNIMKMTDGLFAKVFDEIKIDYPQIATDNYIIDIGTAKIARDPQKFDVIVTTNLYGDIISDVVAEVSGSIGLAGSSNIGKKYAMFEAVHGSAPDIAGQDIANPSGLLNAAIMMLNHMGIEKQAMMIRNAMLKTLEDGIHTSDLYGKNSKVKVGTKEFANQIIARLGEMPKTFATNDHNKIENSYDKQDNTKQNIAGNNGHNSENTIIMGGNKKSDLVGVDLYIKWNNSYKELATTIVNNINADQEIKLALQMISSRGSKIWPNADVKGDIINEFRCRFIANNQEKIAVYQDVINLMHKLTQLGIAIIKSENLYVFNNKELGFSLAQGD